MFLAVRFLRGAVFEAARRPKTAPTKNRPCITLLIDSPDPFFVLLCHGTLKTLHLKLFNNNTWSLKNFFREGLFLSYSQLLKVL